MQFSQPSPWSAPRDDAPRAEARGFGPGLGFGLATGALAAGALAYGTYGPYDAPRYYGYYGPRYYGSGYGPYACYGGPYSPSLRPPLVIKEPGKTFRAFSYLVDRDGGFNGTNPAGGGGSLRHRTRTWSAL